MRYGISAASLIVHKDQLLLVHHKQAGQYDFWVPPGGRLQGTESIFDCAKRETYEETGLIVELDHILYIQEFSKPDYHFCKFFILSKAFEGELTLENKEHTEDFLVEVRFFSRDELRDITVYPDILKTQFWDDVITTPLPTRYLGLEHI